MPDVQLGVIGHRRRREAADIRLEAFDRQVELAGGVERIHAIHSCVGETFGEEVARRRRCRRCRRRRIGDGAGSPGCAGTSADGAGIEATVWRSDCSSCVIDDSRTFVSSAFSRSTRDVSATFSMTSFWSANAFWLRLAS